MPCLLAGWAWLSPLTQAQVPQVISYEGRVAVNGVNFDSATAGQPGVFRFALVNADGTETFWSNDGTSVAGSEPTDGVSLTVSKGLYSVLLGDTAAPLSMTAISGAVFAHPDVRLRVWFDDGTNGSQKLSPDRRIASVAYAVMAGDVPDGSISSAKMAAGAVGSAQLAPNAVQTGSIAAGAVDNTKLANAGLTVAAGAGLGGGGMVSLGGTVTLSNAGVLSVAGGGGITVSGANGNVTLGSNAGELNTPGTIVMRDANGDFAAGTITANLIGSAASAATALTAGSALTALTAVTATDFTGLLAGDVTGMQGATVVGMVGGVSAANIAAGAGLANAAASGNVAGAIVLRGAGGDISVGTVTALSFAGNGAGLIGVPGTLPWQTVSAPLADAATNTGYLADHAALVTLTLPAAPSAGDIVRVTGVGAGGWALVPAVGQSVAGYAAGFGPSGAQGAGAAVQYIGANQWQPMAETQLATGAVQSAHIAAGAVGSAQLAPNAVQTGSIAAGAVDNTKLANAGVTVAAGAGLGGGGMVSLGGTVTLNNTGVLSVAGGGGITVSGANGSVTLGSNATELNTPGTLVLRDASGNFSAGTITGNLLGSAASATTALTAGSAVTALTAASATDFTGLLAGDVSGAQGATMVNQVGGLPAAGIASATALVNAATDLNAASTLVRRDANGNFAAGTITGNLAGSATTALTAATAAIALSATDFTGALAGDVFGTQGATIVAKIGGIAPAATNTPGAVVARDASGNFAAGMITAADFVGAGTGLTGVPGTLRWQTVSATAQDAVANTGYLADNAAAVTLTLPAAPSAGDIVRVTGVGAGGWALVPAVGQSVAGYAAGFGPSGAQGAGAAVQYIGANQWQPMAETQLAAGAVQSAHIAAGAVGSAQLAPNAVQAASIAAGAVGSTQLATDAVQAGNIAPGSVDNTKLANAAVTVATGPGLAGGGMVSLGGTLTLNNTGVLSLAGGGGITVSGANGTVTLGSTATELNTPGTLVLRDANGAFTAGTITGNLAGNATTATTALTAGSALTALTAAITTDFTGLLAGDVTGTQGATVVGMVGGVSAANIAAGAGLANAAASGNVAGAIVLRGAGGDISVGTVTALSFAGNGAGLIGVPGTLPWQTVSATTAAAAANTGYLADHAALVTLTLPAAPNAGDIVRVTGVGAGGWALVPGAGQSVAGYAAGLGLSGAQGAGAAVQYIGGNQWQPMAETQLAAGAVQSAHIAPGAVGSAQLSPNAIQTASIAAGAVDNTKLANAGFTLNTGTGLAGGGVVSLGGALTLSIPDGAVTAAKLADGSVSSVKIANAAVGSAHLAANAVQTASIAPGAVDNTKLANAAVTINAGAGLIGGGPLSLGGAVALSIPNGGVTAALLAPGAAAANYAADGQSFGLINNIEVNQWLGTAGTPTFASEMILNTGTGINKPVLTLDRGIAPKGRVSFQRSSYEAGWSGLVLSINADWDDATGYVYDDGGRSQSIMQLEYEWLAPGGYRQNEFNWTSSGRRIWAHYCRTDDSTKAGVAFMASMAVAVPETDTTAAPALQIEGYRGVGDAVQIVLQNNHEATAAASTQLVLRGAGSGGGGTTFSTEWYLGTDRSGTGTNNFYILDGKAPQDDAQHRLFIDPAGNMGIGKSNPASRLDVAGAVNATGYTVNGVPLQTPKFSLTYNAAQVHALGNSLGAGHSWAATESVLNAVSPFGGGAAFVKQAKTDTSRGCIVLPRTWTNGIQVKVRCWYSLKPADAATAAPNNAVVLHQGLMARSAAPTSVSQGFATGWDMGSAGGGSTTFQLTGGTAGEILVDERTYTIPANCDLDGRLILFGRYGQDAADTEPKDIYFLGVTIDQL